MSEQRKPGFGAGYKHGYIFGRDCEAAQGFSGWPPSNKFYVLIKKFRSNDRGNKYTWGSWDTHLNKYAYGLPNNFESFLSEKAVEAKNAGEKLRVLDIGVGSAAQWAGVLERFPNLELSATSITPKEAVPSLRHLVKFCPASMVHRKFPANHFDIVVSHLGVHGMELSAIENAMHVLKPEGHAIISGNNDFERSMKEMEKHLKQPSFYQIVSRGTGDSGRVWTYHLRKKTHFHSGSIFGKAVEWPISGVKRFFGKGLLRAVRKARYSDQLTDFLGGEAGWANWGTDLKRYGKLHRFDFEEFLEQRLEQSARRGQKLRVLDVGVGHGGQWEKLLGHPSLELEATSLSKTFVKSLEGKVKLSTAAKLYRHFTPNSFDLVVSHMGMHGMELSGIENAMHLLKQGGELILTADAPMKKLRLALARAKENYSVVSQNFFTTKKGPIWALHLLKK